MRRCRTITARARGTRSVAPPSPPGARGGPRFGRAGSAPRGMEGFREAVARGWRWATRRTTEGAQYSIAFSVAAALVFGRVGADEVGVQGLSDARVQRLLPSVTLAE